MQKSARAILGILFLAVALIAASLLPAAQFVGVSYADDDKDRDKDRDRDRDRDDEDNDSDNDNDNNDDPEGLVIEASKDTYIRKHASNTNEGANDILRLTHIGSNRALVAFDLSEIEGDEVESATLELYIVRNENDWKEVGKLAKTLTHQTISVHALTQFWEEGNGSNDIFEWNRGNGPGATWQCAVDGEIKNNRPDCSNKWHGGTFESSPTDEISMQNRVTGVWIEFDVTEDVNEFLSGEATNYGWLVKKDQEYLHGAVRFASSEAGNGPRLVLTGLADPNSPPVANDDSASTSEGTPVTIDVLENDSDGDGGVLDVVSVSNPAYGTAVVNGDDTITYTPDGTSSTDSFTYVVEDGQGGSDAGTVAVTIGIDNGPPVASDDSTAADEDTPITINVLSNDSDPDGDAISISSASTPSFGTAAIVTGEILYTPAIQSLRPGQSVVDTFTYTIGDGIEDDTAMVSVTVNGLNDAPAAADGLLLANEDSPASYTLPATDPDAGDAMTFAITDHPDSGDVVLGLGGSIIYTPDLNFVGTDSFTYSATDSHGASDTGTITITVNPVNDPPVAVDDAAPTTPPGVFVIIDVLSNDFDLEGDELDVVAVSTPSHGIAVINPDNTITFTPDLDLIGQDSFDYTLSDGNGGLDTGTVLVTVAGGSLIAINDHVTTEEDEAVQIEVLDNDIGIDETTEIAIAEDPLHGIVSINPDGTIEYVPEEDFFGEDMFVYTIYNDTDFDTATVVVTVLPD